MDKFPNGKYSIIGNRVFAILSTYITKRETENLFEAHKKYIDIQYIIKGREIIYWSFVENLTAIVKYSEQDDIIFFKGENTTGFRMEKTYFSIFFPHDAYKPGCILDQPEKIRKAVVKILI